VTAGKAPVARPANATAAGDGIMIGNGPVKVDAYIDFLCPFCRQFELSSEGTLNALVTDGLIKLVYHPMSFLDEASTTRYSSRAAAASGCASDGGKFREYLRALFVSQPPEGGPGLTDAELIELGISAGLADAAFRPCVLSGRYLDWPPYVTELAASAGVNGTPTVLVAGEPVAASPQAIAAAVAAAARAR
jgi:protein-disulfide isomerase